MLKQQLESQSHALANNAGDIASLLQDAAMRTRELARGLSPGQIVMREASNRPWKNWLRLPQGLPEFHALSSALRRYS